MIVRGKNARIGHVAYFCYLGGSMSAYVWFSGQHPRASQRVGATRYGSERLPAKMVETLESCPAALDGPTLASVALKRAQPEDSLTYNVRGSAAHR
jgi:hypothetical protein